MVDKYVWAGNDPFTGEQVIELLRENENLRGKMEMLQLKYVRLEQEYLHILSRIRVEIENRPYVLPGNPDILEELIAQLHRAEQRSAQRK